MLKSYEETKNLPVALTPEELAQTSESLARHTLEKRKIEREKKAANEVFKERTEDADAQCGYLAAIVEAKTEMRSVKVRVTNDDSALLVYAVRLDTGEEIWRRPMSKEEVAAIDKQIALPLVPQRPGLRLSIFADAWEGLAADDRRVIEHHVRTLDAVVHPHEVEDGPDLVLLEPIPPGALSQPLLDALKGMGITPGVDENGIDGPDAVEPISTTEAGKRAADDFAASEAPKKKGRKKADAASAGA